MGSDMGLERATLKGISSTARTFPVYLPEIFRNTIKEQKHHAGNAQQVLFFCFFDAAQITAYIMFVRQNSLAERVADAMFAKVWTV